MYPDSPATRELWDSDLRANKTYFWRFLCCLAIIDDGGERQERQGEKVKYCRDLQHHNGPDTDTKLDSIQILKWNINWHWATKRHCCQKHFLTWDFHRTLISPADWGHSPLKCFKWFNSNLGLRQKTGSHNGDLMWWNIQQTKRESPINENTSNKCPLYFTVHNSVHVSMRTQYPSATLKTICWS